MHRAMYVTYSGQPPGHVTYCSGGNRAIVVVLSSFYHWGEAGSHQRRCSWCSVRLQLPAAGCVDYVKVAAISCGMTGSTVRTLPTAARRRAAGGGGRRQAAAVAGGRPGSADVERHTDRPPPVSLLRTPGPSNRSRFMSVRGVCSISPTLHAVVRHPFNTDKIAVMIISFIYFFIYGIYRI